LRDARASVMRRLSVLWLIFSTGKGTKANQNDLYRIPKDEVMRQYLMRF